MKKINPNSLYSTKNVLKHLNSRTKSQFLFLIKLLKFERIVLKNEPIDYLLKNFGKSHLISFAKIET